MQGYVRCRPILSFGGFARLTNTQTHPALLWGRKKEGTIAAKHRYPHTQTCPWVCSGEILRLWFGPQTFGWLRKKYAMDFNDKLPIQNVQLYKVFEPTEFVNHKGHWDMHSDLEELIVKIIIWYNVLFFCPLKCIHQIFVLPSIKSGKM